LTITRILNHQQRKQETRFIVATKTSKSNVCEKEIKLKKKSWQFSSKIEERERERERKERENNNQTSYWRREKVDDIFHFEFLFLQLLPG